MKKWRCTVCGYIHEGEESPEICPVCGADRSKFVEIVDPGLMTLTSAHLVAFFFINIIMLGAAVTAGFLSGKLVFKD